MTDYSLEIGQGSDDAIRRFLRAAGADGLTYGNQSTLYEHLVNTREILRSWAQPAWLQTAGAIHSIYSTETHPRPLVPLSARSSVSEVAGGAAEHMAWLFCSIDRTDMLRKLELRGAVPDDGLTAQLCGSTKGATVPVSQEEIFSILILCMAKAAEQTRDHDGRPGLWLNRVSAWGKLLAGGPVPVPPVFDSCRETLDLGSERAARDFWFLAVESISRDPDLAESQFTAASRRCPWIAEPFIGAACVASWKEDSGRSRQLAAEAASLLRQWGTAWDKRVPLADWLAVADALARGERPSAAPRPSGPHPAWWIAGRNLSPPAAVSGPVQNGSGDDSASRRLESYLMLFSANPEHPQMSLYPGLPSRPWYDASGFAIARDLEEHFEPIRDEALQLERAAFHAEREGSLRTGSWDIFMLYEVGRKIPENCARCPVTTRIVEHHAGVQKSSGPIYFSRLSAGTHISPHRGSTNMRVRCQLGLQIPAGDCALRVGTETRQWQPGRAIVFDDFFEHEVWNRTSEDRIVLIVDLWHPELTPREIGVLEGMQRWVFLNAKEICAYWEGNERSRAAAHGKLL